MEKEVCIAQLHTLCMQPSTDDVCTKSLNKQNRSLLRARDLTICVTYKVAELKNEREVLRLVLWRGMSQILVIFMFPY